MISKFKLFPSDKIVNFIRTSERGIMKSPLQFGEHHDHE